MGKHRLVWAVLLLLLLPGWALSAGDIWWTQDGYRYVAVDGRGNSLLLSDAMGEGDGLPQIVGVSFTLFEGETSLKWAQFIDGDGVDKLEQAAPDRGGWIAAGSSSSSDMDNGWHPGSYDGKEAKTDGWVVWLSGLGQITRTRCYGGTDWDSFNALCQARDGGWILVGNTYSSDGDVAGWHDSGDLFIQPDGWAVHIDAQGEILWQVAVGGSGYDEFLAVEPVPGGYLLVGLTDSQDGDVSGGHGARDAWVILLDEDGAILSQACYGGREDDEFTALAPGPEGWLAAGSSWSFAQGADTREDGWAALLDEAGQVQWSRRFGGAGIEHPRRVTYSDNGLWGIAGYSQHSAETTEWIVTIPADGGGWSLKRGEL